MEISKLEACLRLRTGLFLSGAGDANRVLSGVVGANCACGAVLRTSAGVGAEPQ